MQFIHHAYFPIFYFKMYIKKFATIFYIGNNSKKKISNLEVVSIKILKHCFFIIYTKYD